MAETLGGEFIGDDAANGTGGFSSALGAAGTAVGAAFGAPWAGAAISALGGLFGSKKTNSAQENLARQTNQFNAQQAQLNRDFQERMSNTAYQRAVADMKAAGINPILGYSQGGASTPSGASASGVTPPTLHNVTKDASEAAQRGMATAQQFAQIENVKAATEKTKAETANTEVDTRLKQTEFFSGKDPLTWSQLDLSQKWTLLERQVATEIYRTGLTANQAEWVKEQFRNAQKTGKLIEAQTGNVKMDTALMEVNKAIQEMYRDGEAKAASDFWKSGWGGAPAYGLKYYAETANSATGALSNLKPWSGLFGGGSRNGGSGFYNGKRKWVPHSDGSKGYPSGGHYQPD